MIVECVRCPVRGQRCGECAVTVLLVPRLADQVAAIRPLTSELALDAEERRAVSMFVGAGLVNTRAAAGLRACRETRLRREPVCDVG